MKLQMPKKTKLSLVVLALLTGLTATTTLQATTTNNYSVAVELARTTKVEALIDKINALNDNIKIYSMQTGDIFPTKAKINTYFNTTNDVWKNYNGDQITFVLDNQKISLSNIFTTTPSDIVKKTYENSDKFPSFATISADDTIMNIPLSADYSSFYKETQKLLSDASVQISTILPTDTTKTWYQPNGKYGYDIYTYNTTQSQWISIGSTSFAGGNTNSNIVVKSVDDLNNLPAITGMTAMVSDGTTAKKYVYDGSAWVESSSASSGNGGMFNGTGSVLAMATTLFTKSGGSIVDTTAPSGEWSGSKTFTKKDDIATGGYWKTADNSYIVTDSIDHLHALSSLFLTGTTAWIANGSNVILKLKKQIVNSSSVWTYQAENYADVLNYDATGISGMDGKYIYSVTHNEFFYYSINHFVPVNGITFLSKDSSGRLSFTPQTGKRYLLASNDCTSTTCNGTTATGYYAGSKVDGLYTFYLANAGKRKNNLIDATPRASITDTYNNLDTASIVGSTVYLKTVDNKNRLCYKRTDNKYITKGGVVIPTGNNLPFARTCSNATYSGNYLYLNNRTQVTDWTDAPDGAGIRIGSTNYAHYLYSGKDFWTNNGSGDHQQSASEVFTRLSRSALPNITHNLTALTKQVGTEPRYTSNGIDYTADTSFKQWFYSTNGTRTNNILDRVAAGYQIFTSSGTFTVPLGWSEVRVVMVGGGGSGSQYYGGWNITEGGGYAGTVVSQTLSVTSGQNITVTVGQGGASRPTGSNANGYSGSSSSFGSIVAAGGAGGTVGTGYKGHGGTVTTAGGTGHNGSTQQYVYANAWGGQSSGFGNGGHGSTQGNAGNGGVGSGGGGFCSNEYFNNASGAGGRGEVRVYWGM